jgi:chloramphenicol O-acetyltransferase
LIPTIPHSPKEISAYFKKQIISNIEMYKNFKEKDLEHYQTNKKHRRKNKNKTKCLICCLAKIPWLTQSEIRDSLYLKNT